MARDKDDIKSKACRFKIGGHEIDFAKAMPIRTGDMIVLESKYDIKLMSGTAETLTGVRKVSQFVYHFANVVNDKVREEDVLELPFDVIAWIARWINSNGVRSLDDPNFLKPHTF